MDSFTISFEERRTVDVINYITSSGILPARKLVVIEEESKTPQYREWHILCGKKFCTLSFATDGSWWTFVNPGERSISGTSMPEALQKQVGSYILRIDATAKNIKRGFTLSQTEIQQITDQLRSVDPTKLPKVPAGEQKHGVCGSCIYIATGKFLISMQWWEKHHPYVVLFKDGKELLNWENNDFPEAWRVHFALLRKFICTEESAGVNCVCGCPPKGINRDVWEAAKAAGIDEEELKNLM